MQNFTELTPGKHQHVNSVEIPQEINGKTVGYMHCHTTDYTDQHTNYSAQSIQTFSYRDIDEYWRLLRINSANNIPLP